MIDIAFIVGCPITMITGRREWDALRENIDNIIKLAEKNGEAVIDSWSTQLIELARFVEHHIDRICNGRE